MSKRLHPLGGKNFIHLPSIFIPIILFIVFDVIALGLNFWISAKLEISAKAINLSGRQRMLSQRISKSLLMLHIAKTESQKNAAHNELTQAVDLFDKTLTGFTQGGMTYSGDGKRIYLHATEDSQSQLITASAAQLWAIIGENLKPVIHQPANPATLSAALETMQDYNLQLLQSMNDLTTALEQNANQEVFYLRMLQSSLLLLTLLNFGLVCKRLLGQIRQSHNNLQSLRNIIDSIETGILLFDSNDIVRSNNKAANELFGYSGTNLIGKQLQQLIVTDDTKLQGIRSDNSTFVAKINIQTLFEFNDQIGLCSITDVSEQVHKENELMRLAFHDPLTGLPNRVLLMERLQHDLLRAKRDSSFLAVLFLDLDGFKIINDAMGHDAGDELLQLVGKRLQQCCREVDTVARLGGDEFIFILTSLHSAISAKQVAKNILNAINQGFMIQGETVSVQASIGIATYPDDDIEAEALIKCADDAMYLAKQAGKNRFAFACELLT